MKIVNLYENQGYRLKDLCQVATDFEDAHFWLIRKGDIKTVGTPTKKYSEYHIGIGVVRTDIIDPDYLYYAMMHLHSTGYWQNKGKGVLQLTHITIQDVKDVTLGQ